MIKYKKISKVDQKELNKLKVEFNSIVEALKAKLKFDITKNIVETESITTSTILFNNANFFLFDTSELDSVNKAVEALNKIYLTALTIKYKYGYDDVKTFKVPTVIDCLFDMPNVITLSLNQTKKFRKFEEDKIQKWCDNDYKSMYEFWQYLIKNDLIKYCGFAYLANDYRVRLENKEQISLNNGVFVGVDTSTQTTLNIRYNTKDSVKRLDYKGDSRFIYQVISKDDDIYFYSTKKIDFPIFLQVKVKEIS